MDYVGQNGGKDYVELPFNDVDQLVWAALAYVRFEDQGRDRMTIAEAAELVAAMPGGAKEKARVKEDLELLGKAARSRRCGKSEIILTRSVFDSSKEEQFSAILVDVGPVACAAYRGTDSTLLGWKEVFNMSFSPEVPEQKDALAFLIEASKLTDKPLVLTGHGNGGNLALYAFIKAPAEVKSRIVAAYSNDGPGFLGSSMLDGLDSRARVFVPESSMTGILLEHPEDITVVKCSSVSILQHDCHRWRIEGASLLQAQERDSYSRRFDRKLRDAIADADSERRRFFVDSLYAIADTFDQARRSRDPRALAEAGKSVADSLSSMSPEDRAFISGTLVALVKSAMPRPEDIAERARAVIKQGSSSEEAQHALHGEAGRRDPGPAAGAHEDGLAARSD